MFPGEKYSRLRTLRSQRCLPAKKPLWRNLAAPLATDQAAHRLRTQRATPHRPAVAGGDCFPNVPPRTSEKSNTSKGSGRRRIMELVQRLMIRFGSAADMCSPRADVRALESICRKPEKATCRGPRISLQRRPASSAARSPNGRGLKLHGLRATAVINLRRAGLSYAQIGDIVGMSAKMVEHYCRNAGMRSNSRAALTHLERAIAR